jgi:hypothetical protein
MTTWSCALGIIRVVTVCITRSTSPGSGSEQHEKHKPPVTARPALWSGTGNIKMTPETNGGSVAPHEKQSDSTPRRWR